MKPSASGPAFWSMRWSMPASTNWQATSRCYLTGLGSSLIILPPGQRRAGGVQRGPGSGARVPRPGRRHFGIARAASAGRTVGVDKRALGLGGQSPIAELGGDSDRNRPAGWMPVSLAPTAVSASAPGGIQGSADRSCAGRPRSWEKRQPPGPTTRSARLRPARGRPCPTWWQRPAARRADPTPG